jgi:tRNA A-37 threonylcarbamoyl transferase component Bud32
MARAGKGAGKPCGASFISQAKVCRVSLPPTVANAINQATANIQGKDFWAAMKHMPRGAAAKANKIRGEYLQQLKVEGIKQIRKPEHIGELRRRYQEAGVLPKREATKEEGDRTKLNRLKEERQNLVGKTGVSALKRRLELADEIPRLQNKINQPDPLYGGWETDQLKKFRQGIDKDPKFEDARKAIDGELRRREQLEAKPRVISQSPGAKKADSMDLMMDDISRLMRGESPQHIQMITDEGGRFKSKSQIAQLQSVLGLGAQTRIDVGRDLEGLVNEAKDLRRNLKEEIDAAKPNTPKRAKLIKRLNEVEKAIEGPATGASAKTKYGREKSRDIDDVIEKNGVKQQIGESNYKWETSYGSGSKVLGSGAFGTVIKETGNTPNAVKRGAIGEDEARLIQKLGENDLGPRLKAAQLDGPHPSESGTRYGRMAMDVLPGKPIGGKRADDEINGVKVADSYWGARAKLHRLGIAHNDMHIDNVFIDSNGKGRFVDMGLAQDSPKAALAEALGVFTKPTGSMVTRSPEARGQGDWQMRRWNGTGGEVLKQWERAKPQERAELLKRFPTMARVFDQRSEAMYKMKKMGLNNDDIATIMDHGIRSPMSSYSKGPWAKISDSQALEIINTLYEGV